MNDWNQKVFDRIQGRAWRSVVCCCGWAGTYKTLAAANAVIADHLLDGSEGCDHVINMEDAA
jgi:hypothetical protein